MDQLYIYEGKKRRKAKEATCQKCGKVFLCRLAWNPTYCSRQCVPPLNPPGEKVTLQCAHCGNEFSRLVSKMKSSKHRIYFCSRTCKDTAQSLHGDCDVIRPFHYRQGRGVMGRDVPTSQRFAFFRQLEDLMRTAEQVDVSPEQVVDLILKNYPDGYTVAKWARDAAHDDYMARWRAARDAGDDSDFLTTCYGPPDWEPQLLNPEELQEKIRADYEAFLKQVAEDAVQIVNPACGVDGDSSVHGEE